MKNLKKMIDERASAVGFPIQGENGYGGEQDGSQVIFDGVFLIPSLKIAKEIEIGEGIGIHWWKYHRGRGWELSLAHWSDTKTGTGLSKIEKYLVS